MTSHPVTRARVLPSDPAAIAEAGAILRNGGLVAFPTETVYGLGANATDADAVGRIFAAKGRPADNPLIVHVADADALAGIAREVTPLAQSLAARWWPGPLTLVLDARPGLPAVTTGGHSTVGVRLPAHPVARALIRAAGVGVAAPSANRSGRPSPTTAAHVVADLGERVDLVVDAGACEVGLESTVIDARGDRPIVLREGAVTREQLDATDAPGWAASPGTRYKHYAPACRVELRPAAAVPARAAALAAAGERVGVIVPGCTALPAGVRSLAAYDDVASLARDLYAALRRADEAGLDVVVAATVEEDGFGRAVADRLRRAAAG